MRISEYPEVASMLTSDKILIDGERGAKSISADNLAKEFVGIGGNIYSLADAVVPVEMRKNIWRGKFLGNAITTEQKRKIYDGTFKDLFVGDYWTINDINWRIVDFNYWRNSGRGSLTSENYVVIMPDKGIYSSKMNDEATTTGGYARSKIMTTAINEVNAIVEEIFKPAYLCSGYMLFSNSVDSSGCAIDTEWIMTTCLVPNETMIYGTTILGKTNVETNDKTQLSAMRMAPELIGSTNPQESYWLRDTVSPTEFAFVESGYSILGLASKSEANGEHSIRPVFCYGGGEN